MDRKDELLLNLAKMVIAEINGSGVHPSEDFDAEELLLLSLGEEKLLSIIQIALGERLRLNDTWKEYKTIFYVDISTLEISSEYDKKLHGDNYRTYYSQRINYYTIKNYIRDSADKLNIPNMDKWQKVINTKY